MFSKKITLFIAANAMAFFLGAISVRAADPVPPPPPIVIDTDGDGVPDFEPDGTTVLDLCPNTDLLASTVLIESCDTGIPNTAVNAVGCTLADLIDEMIDTCADGVKNHGKFVSCVAHETNILKRAKTITGKQKGKIQSCAAHIK
jgi:hypothetical protein